MFHLMTSVQKALCQKVDVRLDAASVRAEKIGHQTEK